MDNNIDISEILVYDKKEKNGSLADILILPFDDVETPINQTHGIEILDVANLDICTVPNNSDVNNQEESSVVNNEQDLQLNGDPINSEGSVSDKCQNDGSGCMNNDETSVDLIRDNCGQSECAELEGRRKPKKNK